MENESDDITFKDSVFHSSLARAVSVCDREEVSNGQARRKMEKVRE